MSTLSLRRESFLGTLLRPLRFIFIQLNFCFPVFQAMWERAGEIAIVFGLLWIWSAYYLRFVDRAERNARPPAVAKLPAPPRPPKSGN